MKKLLLFSGLLFALSSAVFANEIFIFDDFSSGSGISKIGTRWEGFTDRVMGGVSDIQADLLPGESGNILRMRGNVSLENNGGFVQVRLPLVINQKSYDASDYSGIVLRVRGRGDGYYIFLRTVRTRFPWAYFEQKIPVSENWQEIRLPFSGFSSENMVKGSLDTKNLTSIGIVAAKKQFYADLEVDYIGFYR